ncbi:AraC family transcriptional regulator [Ochrobactrum sp. BTU2]|uniref:helix-turn-helix transcriptional regulator n=1 Tax=Ochrobactrum sp. BTU2 TaxID=2856166 RepID=UPI002119D6B0|nr:AraC family transcriptional regulator [Ochrobactrum sp. BTU2]
MNWRVCVDTEIDQLGWRKATRVEQPDDDVTIYTIEVMPVEDLVFRPEGPATFSLSVFLDGSGTLSVDGAKPFQVQPGTAVFFACDRIARGENHVNAGRRLSFVDIRVETPLLEKLGGISFARFGGAVITDHSLPDQEVFLIGFKAPLELLNVATNIVECRFGEGLARRAYLYSKAIEAVAVGFDAVTRQNSMPLKPLRGEELKLLHAAVALIEQHYSTNWTIARLSREVGLNERRLKEGFRLVIGTSIHAYLRTMRLDAAAALLSSGSSVTEAAYAVGFDNLSHFSKAFRDVKGTLPSRYKR